MRAHMENTFKLILVELILLCNWAKATQLGRGNNEEVDKKRCIIKVNRLY